MPGSGDDKPGVLDRLRARYPWFDHVMRAQERYQETKGDFFAAGITYFTVFALFPLLMVGFAITGFVLASQPDVLNRLERRITATVSGDVGQQLVDLMNTAIDSRTSLGLFGLATAAWAGLGWMNNLREALSAMWEQHSGTGNFLGTKLSDLAALLSAFLAIVVTVGLTALGDRGLITRVLGYAGIEDIPGLAGGLKVLSMLIAVGISWLLFTWMIARLPREKVTYRSAARAGLLAAVAFEVFKQVGTVYLRSVLQGPAGATFGPVLGLMVFAYITARLVLFATAWAATSPENMTVSPPGPAIVTTSVRTRDEPSAVGTVAAAAAGVAAGVGLARLRGRRRSGS
ncbi:inner membrane protein YhjD [Mycobacterium sp. MYCO198283]|uniref:inner membrane protein YhjD n=1 Tax=Mycobacterium sp. MYCO198283 TaxID=2883505 RepID=UPI001E596A49|nr:inner membrane protein YhjD [Mycobacterium sp. MYCO198283]MCG5431721.1 inner membrane protein YhjD [Mycobacterium sp. MYCO198283]